MGEDPAYGSTLDVLFMSGAFQEEEEGLYQPPHTGTQAPYPASRASHPRGLPVTHDTERGPPRDTRSSNPQSRQGFADVQQDVPLPQRLLRGAQHLGSPGGLARGADPFSSGFEGKGCSGSSASKGGSGSSASKGGSGISGSKGYPSLSGSRSSRDVAPWMVGRTGRASAGPSAFSAETVQDDEDDFSDEESDSDDQRQQPFQPQLLSGTFDKELSGIDLDNLLQSLPLDSQGQPTSIGSMLHESGKCKVCFYAHSRYGCMNGVFCNFCHFTHKHGRRKNKVRPCKGKRDRYLKLVGRLTNQIDLDPDNFDINAVDLPPSVATDEATKTKLIAALTAHVNMVRAMRYPGQG